MVEASAVDPGPPSNGFRGIVAVTAAMVAAPFTNFRLLNLDFSVFEVVGSFSGLSMCLLPYLFEQLWWASASDLIARIENSKRRGDRQKQMRSIGRTKRHESEQRVSALLKSKTVTSIPKGTIGRGPISLTKTGGVFALSGVQTQLMRG